ncbi:hypothetical protein EYF80_011650 [Liparis tanakae]|uniref:Uncharacterized protein n=1 Tax=Liparis tanakae TaxID=230148 RepID=A0A4Z2IK12_9TELE|nr:hypothetical protein EYF80_011650 [Liparis tanakae]
MVKLTQMNRWNMLRSRLPLRSEDGDNPTTGLGWPLAWHTNEATPPDTPIWSVGILGDPEQQPAQRRRAGAEPQARPPGLDRNSSRPGLRHGTTAGWSEMTQIQVGLHSTRLWMSEERAKRRHADAAADQSGRVCAAWR